MNDFKPGIYKHYKGGLYRALGLCVHHESRETYVIYVSLTKGAVNIRPLSAVAGDLDSWNSNVWLGDNSIVQRFAFVGDSLK